MAPGLHCRDASRHPTSDAAHAQTAGRGIGLRADAAASCLVQALRARHPEAGPAFRALRAWAGLVWQPVYACVMAAELTGHVLPLAHLTWDIDIADADVAGIAVPTRRLRATAVARCRAQAASEVEQLADVLRPAVQACSSLHPKAARRLLADCVLSALLRAQRAAGLDNEALRAAGTDWLACLGAAGDSGFLAYTRGDGAARLAIDRRVCCLDDRRAGGERCDTCPRRGAAERLARLRAATAVAGPAAAPSTSEP